MININRANRIVKALRKGDFMHLANVIKAFSAELEQVKRERDAAVRDIYDMKACALCKHYPDGTECETYFLLCIECNNTDCICKGCINGERLEWRGVKEGSDD